MSRASRERQPIDAALRDTDADTPAIRITLPRDVADRLLALAARLS